jgi:general stress protein YciG
LISKKRRIERARKGGLKGGKIRAMDKKGLSEAGKIGGTRCREIYGVIFFSIISHKRKNKRGRNSYHNKRKNKKL